jgi:hypothetical protein
VIARYESEVAGGARNSDELRKKAYIASELVRGFGSLTTKFPLLEMTAQEIKNSTTQWSGSLQPGFPTELFIGYLQDLEGIKYTEEGRDTQNSNEFLAKSRELIERFHELAQR